MSQRTRWFHPTRFSLQKFTNRLTHSPSAWNSRPSSSVPSTSTRVAVSVAGSRSRMARLPLARRDTSPSRRRNPMIIGKSSVTLAVMVRNDTVSEVAWL